MSKVAVRMVKITDRKPGEWTVDDLEHLPDDGKRYEIIDGVLYVSPSPFRPHQRAVGRLLSYVDLYCRDHRCGEVYVAPFDVRFSRKSVVEPDLVYVANDRLEILRDVVEGVPTLTVEVLSSNPRLDRVKKLNLYSSSGVPHYWLCDPGSRTLEALQLREGTYSMVWVGQEDDVFRPSLFPGLEIPLAELWLPPTP